MNLRSAPRWGRLALLFVVLASLAIAVAPRSAWAAKLTDDEIKALKKELTSLGTDVNSMKGSGTVTDKQKFDRFYEVTALLFTAEKNASDAAKLRQQLRQQHLIPAGNAADKEAHDRLVAFLLRKCQDIAKTADELPSTRVNAMLIVGDLNSQELARGGTGSSVPLAAALPVLLAEYRDPAQIDAVKLACLVGMHRHAEAKIADKPQVNDLHAEMLKTINDKQGPQGRSEDGQAWFRRKALEVLMAIGLPTAEKDAVAEIQSVAGVLDDSTAPLWLRCDAARALGSFKLTAKGIDLSKLAYSAAQVAVEASKRANSQRALRYYMASVDACLNGPAPPPTRPNEQPPTMPPTGIVKAAAGTPHEQYVASIVEQVKDLNDLGTADKVEEKKFPDQAFSLGEQLADWLSNNPPQAELAAK